MKKFKFFLLLSLLSTMLLAFCSCGAKELDAPSNLTIDEENLLTWSDVPDAYSYEIEIKNVETGLIVNKKPKKEAQSLSDLAQGFYEIRIRSVARGDEFKNSEWCETVDFEKAYETGCLYTLINNRTEYEITKVGKASGEVYIAPEYRNKPLTRIGTNAFKGNNKVEKILVDEECNLLEIGEKAFFNCANLKEIVLPDSVITIGTSAFNSCRALKKVNIPEKVTVINDFTFSYCRALEQIELHDNIVSIGEGAFTACSALTELEIPDSVTFLGEDAFSECSALTSVTLGGGIEELPANTFYSCSSIDTVTFDEENSITEIGSYAFGKCAALTTISLPAEVETIGQGAFNDCTLLETVTLGENVESIGPYTFTGTKLFEDGLNATGYVYVGDWLVFCSSDVRKTIREVDVESLKEGIVGIADTVFHGSLKLHTVTIPASLKYIGTQAFAKCLELKKVTSAAGNSLVNVGEGAFNECTILNQVFFAEGLEKIGAYAFSNCTQLVGRNDGISFIPSTVTHIGTSAFAGTGLWNNPAEDGVVYAGNWAVGVNAEAVSGGVGAVKLKEGTVGISDYAFFQSTVTTVEGATGVAFVGEGAFYECASLLGFTFGADVTEIRDYTFYKCTGMRSIGFPRRLTSIGRSAFYKCEGLTSVNLSSATTLETINPYAFYSCTSLSTVKLANNVKEIADYAFYKCVALEDISITASVERIGARAFYKCEALTTVDFSKATSLKTISEYAFSSCTALKAVSLPNSLETVEKYAFYKCASVETLRLGTSVKNVGQYAFYGFEKIQTLSLPNSLEVIGKYAFKGAKALDTIVLSSTIDEINEHAFYGCTNATVYTDASATDNGWNKRWNSSYRPVIWGCTFSDDGSYVVSVTVTETTVQNPNAQNGISAPRQLGMRFMGWATSADATTAEYTAAQIAEVPVGTVLYAIWE